MGTRLVVNLRAFLIPVIIVIIGLVLMAFENLPILVRMIGGILALSAILASFCIVLLLLGMYGAARELERREVEARSANEEKLKNSQAKERQN